MAEGTWQQAALEGPGLGRTCGRCGEWKTADHFSLRGDRPGKLFSVCRECISVWNAEYYRNGPKVLIEVQCQFDECGKGFMPVRSGVKYCSHRCSSQARKRAAGVPRLNIVLDGMKRCNGCEEVLPITEFPAKRGQCRPCVRARGRAKLRAKRGLPLDAPTSDLLALATRLPVGTTRVDGCGYLREKAPGHHRANKAGWVLQHIKVLEDHLGIEIPVGYTVHHKNGDRQDNRPENLALRKGNHGPGGDVLPALLRHASERSDAIRELLDHPDYRAELFAEQLDDPRCRAALFAELARRGFAVLAPYPAVASRP